VPAGQILQERQLDPETGAIEDQVVCLGDRQLGRDERLTFGPQDVGHRFVARFVGVGPITTCDLDAAGAVAAEHMASVAAQPGCAHCSIAVDGTDPHRLHLT